MAIQLARLSRLQQGLSIEERFDAVLSRYREGLPVEPTLIESLPDRDVRRWNRLTGLLSATHSQLGWYIEYVEATVTQLELRHAVLMAVQLASIEVERQLLGLLLDPEAEEPRAVLGARRDGLERTAEALSRRIVEELVGRWVDVRVAEETAAALALECWGRDLIHPEMRQKLEDCRGRITALQEELRSWLEVELPEPRDRDVERLLALLEQEAER